MGYSPWGHEELDLTERLTVSLSFKIRAKESPLFTTRAPRLGCILFSLGSWPHSPSGVEAPVAESQGVAQMHKIREEHAWRH